jgi:hypothetical protein
MAFFISYILKLKHNYCLASIQAIFMSVCTWLSMPGVTLAVAAAIHFCKCSASGIFM